MREIEIKARVHDMVALRAIFTQQGVALSHPVTQHDRVYGLPGIAGGGDNDKPWLRIRTQQQDGITTHLFTLKRSVTSELDSIEHETAIADPEELQHIIDQLGFVLYSELTKIRQTAMHNGISICLDTVEGLGDFIELEKITEDNASAAQIIDELWRTAALFGIMRDDEVAEGYDVLIVKKETP